MSRDELTSRRKHILDFIVRATEENGYPPTVRDIGEAVGLKSSSTVHFHLKALEKAGYIERDGCLTRAIRFTGGGKADGRREPMRYVPLVGRVAAGQPIFADQNIDEMLPLPDSLFPPGELFMLQVRGESMIEDGILDGDYVVVTRQNAAENGETVVAMIDDEATVKRFYRHPGHVELRPANSTMEPIIARSIQIVGRVCGVIRAMR
jgi:repressor LexA